MAKAATARKSSTATKKASLTLGVKSQPEPEVVTQTVEVPEGHEVYVFSPEQVAYIESLQALTAYLDEIQGMTAVLRSKATGMKHSKHGDVTAVIKGLAGMNHEALTTVSWEVHRACTAVKNAGKAL
jgi:hypothetical protein